MKGKKFLVSTVAMSLALAIALGGAFAYNKVQSNANLKEESTEQPTIQKMYGQELENTDENIKDVCETKTDNVLENKNTEEIYYGEETGATNLKDELYDCIEDVVSPQDIIWLGVKMGYNYLDNNCFTMAPSVKRISRYEWHETLGSYKFNGKVKIKNPNYNKKKKTSKKNSKYITVKAGDEVIYELKNIKTLCRSPKLYRVILISATKRGAANSKNMHVYAYYKNKGSNAIVRSEKIGTIKGSGSVSLALTNGQSGVYPYDVSIGMRYGDTNTWDLTISQKDEYWSDHDLSR